MDHAARHPSKILYCAKESTEYIALNAHEVATLRGAPLNRAKRCVTDDSIHPRANNTDPVRPSYREPIYEAANEQMPRASGEITL